MPVAAELIGTEIQEVTFPIDRSKIMEITVTTQNAEPLFAREHIGSAADADVPAPLNWPVLMAHWIDAMAMMKVLKLDLRRVLHGGSEWEYLGAVTAGDTVTAKQRIGDVSQREGKRGGSMTLIKIDTEFTNQHGELVAREISTVIETGG